MYLFCYNYQKDYVIFFFQQEIVFAIKHDIILCFRLYLFALKQFVLNFIDESIEINLIYTYVANNNMPDTYVLFF